MPATPASTSLAEFQRLITRPGDLLAELPHARLTLVLRAAHVDIANRDRKLLPRIERWLEDLRPWGESRIDYWMLRCCWLVESAPDEVRSHVKAQLYRATLMSRLSHQWLLPAAHDRAEGAMHLYGKTLSPERAAAMRSELSRIRALRKQRGS